MRIGKLALVSVALSLLSGCAMMTKQLPAPCGVNDYIDTNVGQVMTGVSLPTDEAGKKYNVVLPKKGFWISSDCDNRLGR